MASQIEPSASSESPHSTQTWYGSLSRYWPASATPTPIGRPWPSEPVATSTHGMTGVGWPCRREPNLRQGISSASGMAPTALNLAEDSGDAWPLEEIKWSLVGSFGLR